MRSRRATFSYLPARPGEVLSPENRFRQHRVHAAPSDSPNVLNRFSGRGSRKSSSYVWTAPQPMNPSKSRDLSRRTSIRWSDPQERPEYRNRAGSRMGLTHWSGHGEFRDWVGEIFGCASIMAEESSENNASKAINPPLLMAGCPKPISVLPQIESPVFAISDV